ncbi:MAG: hypothetical protein FH748_14695 [Balneolaceae bacterium]|nr:hypothetical protein [Balneolaceae bacterium]
MKKKLIYIFFEIPVFMAAGVGLFQVVHLLFSPDGMMPIFFIWIGLLGGLLIWKLELNTIKKIPMYVEFKYVKFYIYVSTFIAYTLSIVGILSCIRYMLGYNVGIIEFVPELLSWKLLIILLPYAAAWDTSAEVLINDAKEHATQNDLAEGKNYA